MPILKHLGLVLAASLLVVSATHAAGHQEVGRAIKMAYVGLHKAMSAGDAQAAAKYWTEDTILKLPGQEPLNGRAAVAKANQELLDKHLNLWPHTDEVIDFGDMALELGHYELVSKGGALIQKGNYSTLWKNVDGDWRIYRDTVSMIKLPPLNE